MKGVGKWIGAGSEDETPRDGTLSSRAEWHSVLIGLAVGAIIALTGGKDAAWLFIVLATVALGGKKVNVGHLQHVSDEPMYALVAAVVSFLVTASVIIPHLPSAVW